MRGLLATAAFLLIFAASLGAQVPHDFAPGFNLFETAGCSARRGSAVQVSTEKVVVKDPVLTDYVNSVGERPATLQEAPSSRFWFTLKVVADPTINAFALPGGHIFTHSGVLLRAVENEAQLDGVLGYGTGDFRRMKASVMKMHEPKPQPQQQQPAQ